ncbi:MAG: hypothetical protein EOO88_10080 [Pedobacter sp.]|nr:MAG: hypothetical protein EOO88_10080 [Pedobacter sp.]
MIFKKIIGAFFDVFRKVTARIRNRYVLDKQNEFGHIASPKSVKFMFKAVFIFVCLIAISTALLQTGVLIPAKVWLDRETGSAVKVPNDIGRIFSTDEVNFSKGSDEIVESEVDCDRILKNFQRRGTMKERDKYEWTNFCRNKLPPEIMSLVEKLEKAGLAAPTVAQIMQKANKDNAAAIEKAIADKTVKQALIDNDDSIAEHLAELGSLPEQDIEKAVLAVRDAPPQHRGKMFKALEEISKVSSPDARADLVNALANAKSADEVDDIAKFSKSIQLLKEPEQEAFSRAFEKSPTPAAKQAVMQTLDLYKALPADDKMREKMISNLQEISNAPEGEREAALLNLSKAVKSYANEKDPEVKALMLDNMNSPESIAELAKNFEAIEELERAGIKVEKEKRLKAASPSDPANAEENQYLFDAANIAKTGNKKFAEKAMNDNLSKDEKAEAERDVENHKQQFNQNKSSDNMDKKTFERTIGDRDELKKEQVRISREIEALQAQGIKPTDVRMLNQMKALSAVTDKLNALDDILKTARTSLEARQKALTADVERQFAEVGLVMQKPTVDLPKDDKSYYPSERLTDIQSYREFFQTDFGGRKKIQREFQYVTGDGSSGRPELLAGIMKGKNPWYAPQPGNGTQLQISNNAEFEMSRLYFAPGNLLRIPKECYSSDTVAGQTVQFRLMRPVANRKTNKIELPEGAVVICRPKDINESQARLNAICQAVDTGGSEDIKVNFVLVGADGVDGVPGIIKSNRGWKLAATFATAFFSGVVDALLLNKSVTSLQEKAAQNATNNITVGAATGTGQILTDIGAKQVQEWQSSPVQWCGYEGMIATVRQQ